MQGFQKKNMKMKNFKLDLESIEANDDSANGFVLFCFVIWTPNCVFFLIFIKMTELTVF
jgi:hypothetical protein